MNEETKGQFYPELVGPFPPEYRITIDGYKVPYVTVKPFSEDRIEVLLDNRFGMEPVSREEFDRWIHIVANAMAIAAGYSCHGEHCAPINPHKTKLVSLGPLTANLSVIDGGKESPQ